MYVSVDGIKYTCQLQSRNVTSCTEYVDGDYVTGVQWKYTYNSSISNPSKDLTPCTTMTKDFTQISSNFNVFFNDLH